MVHMDERIQQATIVGHGDLQLHLKSVMIIHIEDKEEYF
jgi:hypothetical protein